MGKMWMRVHDKGGKLWKRKYLKTKFIGKQTVGKLLSFEGGEIERKD